MYFFNSQRSFLSHDDLIFVKVSKNQIISNMIRDNYLFGDHYKLIFLIKLIFFEIFV
jgi:hypothetical protein